MSFTFNSNMSRFTNKESDLVNMDLITSKLKNFKKETKKDFQIVSLVSKQNFEKVKKIIHSKCI